MGYILPVLVGAGLLGAFAWKKSSAGGAQHVPMGSASVPLGIAAQQAAHSNDPISASMSTKDAQAALNQLGAKPPLAVDGSQGPLTTAAVKSFQAQAGLTADGVVGPQTASALRLATGSSGGSAVMGAWFCKDPHDGQELPAHYVGVGAGIDPDLASAEIGHVADDAVVALYDFGADDLATHLQAELAGNYNGDADVLLSDVVIALFDFGADDLATAFQHWSGASAVSAVGCEAVGIEYAGQQAANDPYEPPCAEGDFLEPVDNKCWPMPHVSGGEYDEESEHVGQFGGQEWSAPSEAEAMADPEQRAEMQIQQQWEERAEEAYPGEAYGHYAQPNLYEPGYVAQPVSRFGFSGMGGARSFVPMGMSTAPSEYSRGNLEAVNAQGAEFATQPGADVRL